MGARRCHEIGISIFVFCIIDIHGVLNIEDNVYLRGGGM
jgi:hypothetical protein